MEQFLSWWNPEELRTFAARAGSAAAIFFGFWVAAQIVQVVIRRMHRHVDGSADLLDLLGRTAKMAVLVFGFITALGTLGIDVSALVAGLGLTGFALGFAFRDVLSNLLAGVLILLYKPFHRGDHIIVSGLDGTVTEIDLRYTRLKSEGKIILIPNSNLFTNPITVNRGE